MPPKPAPAKAASPRKRPASICPRCEGLQDRRTAIREKVGGRFWGDVEPHLLLGDEEIYHFLCRECGNVSAYQLHFDKPW